MPLFDLAISGGESVLTQAGFRVAGDCGPWRPSRIRDRRSRSTTRPLLAHGAALHFGIGLWFDAGRTASGADLPLGQMSAFFVKSTAALLLPPLLPPCNAGTPNAADAVNF
jgi:hypothetical protein